MPLDRTAVFVALLPVSLAAPGAIKNAWLNLMAVTSDGKL